MKTLSVLILLITTYFVSYSQSDTICVNRADLVRKLKQVEELKVKAVELDTLKVRYQDLSQLVSIKDERIGNYQNQITLKDETIKSFEKALRSQKRKTFFTGVAGLVLAGSLIFLMK